MDSNLNSDYVAFVEQGGDLKNILQEIIDRIQYYGNEYLQHIVSLNEQFEDPFEEMLIDNLPVRSLKQQFQRKSQNDTENKNSEKD